MPVTRIPTLARRRGRDLKNRPSLQDSQGPLKILPGQIQRNSPGAGDELSLPDDPETPTAGADHPVHQVKLQQTFPIHHKQAIPLGPQS